MCCKNLEFWWCCRHLNDANKGEVGRVVAYWLRHYATNWQVAGSIPDDVIGIFQ
jgi:hypothetical protein